MTAHLSLRIAAGLLWFSALGFGLPCLPAIRNVLTGRPVPTMLGFPAYGGGPFERHGIHSTVWLLAAFLMVCVLEGVAGWLLWGGHKSGAVLALALVPVGAVFWWGFALPVPWVLAFVRTILILVSWGDLG